MFSGHALFFRILQTVSGTPSGTQSFQKQFEYDGLGRLTSVCEISSTLTGVGTCAQNTSQSGYWTKYTYDALGHLLTVTQNAQASSTSQQARSFTYDMLGRMTSETNPETGNNGTSGTTNYTYDSTSTSTCGSTPALGCGDLVKKVDAASNTTNYTYDTLHRLLTAGNSGISGATLRKFVYDSEGSYPTGVTVVNGKTRIVEAQTTTTSGSLLTDEFFSYDKDGRLTDVYESTPHSGTGYYHSNASYWPNGVLNKVSLLNSSATALIPAQTYGVDGEGRPSSVSAASGQNPVTGVTYSSTSTTNPLGALTNVTFGSGDSDAFTYDPNTGRMSTYTLSVNSQTDVGTLTWSANGTLTGLVINDQISGTADSQSCTYGYDDLWRVSGVTCGSLWTQSFTYDAFGNIQKSGSLNFVPVYLFASNNNVTTNQFYSLPGVSVSYDKNGNLLTDNLNTYTWDPNWGTMLTATPTGGTTVTATYDALGRMVENNSGGTWTEFAYGPTGKLAKCNGQTLVKAFVSLPGGAKAIYTSSGLAYYRHSDWLGSSRLTSTAATPTSMYSSSAYAPFGEQYATAGSADASYTGQDQDTVSNLYDFSMRRQSPSQGRWISPDPAGTAAVILTNPQSWNRYAYVLNNPLSLIDRLGLAMACYWDDDGTWDDPPEDGGATEEECEEQGGTWADNGLGNDNSGNPSMACNADGSVCVPCDDPNGCTASDLQDQLNNCLQGLADSGQGPQAINNANAMWDTIQTAADANNIDPALLAAVGIEETGFNNVWQGCTTEANCANADGAGIWQIDLGPKGGNPNVSVQQAFNPAWAANYAANLLSNNMNTLAAQFPNFTPDQLTQATAASYNFGTPNISGNPATIDVGTQPNGNYGATVLALMDCF